VTGTKSPIQFANDSELIPFATTRAGLLSQRDYYDILGVPRSASAEEIRKAYKKLARKYHPDANADTAGAEQKFAEITEANEVLGDTDKRKKYDQFGENWSRVPDGATGGNPFNGFGGHGFGGGGPGGFSMEDLLGGAFGGGSPFGGRGGGPGGRPPRPQKGEDLRTSIQVPFLVGVEGGEHELTVKTGGKSDRLSFRIPPGIESGKTIRLAGQGHGSPTGGPPGDVLVTINVARHPYFRRERFNLVIEVPITVTEATLGAKIEVPTLVDGPVILSVPEGTSSGSRLRLRGNGVLNKATETRGDQDVIIKIVVSKDLTEEATELLRKFDEAAPHAPRDGLW
jgi:DnaJ-class molecular chaperone